MTESEGTAPEPAAEPATDDRAAADDGAATDAAEPSSPAESSAPAETAASAHETPWQRRKRLAAVFGDVLPDATRDERGPDSGKGDDWYRSQVPPHHG